jgi:hypothetical protein
VVKAMGQKVGEWAFEVGVGIGNAAMFWRSKREKQMGCRREK